VVDVRSTKKLLIVIIIAFICLSVFAIEYQNPQWKGTIEEADGVKVIKNPNEPLYGNVTFELEEDLSIGNEEDENFRFHRPGMPIVDSDGNIFVLDRGNYRVQKYDSNGKYLKSIGRHGQGPGEFERPSYLYLDHSNNIYVGDGRHIDVFNKNGIFKKTFKTTGYEFHLGITKEGNIFAQIDSLITPERGTQEIALINPEGDRIKTIVSFPIEKSPPLGGALNFYVSNPYHPSLYACYLNGEYGVYGYSSEYRLFIVTPSGEIAYIIKNDELGEVFTSKEKDELLDRKMKELKQSRFGSEFSRSEVKRVYKFPKYKPFFSSILKDDKDRIYVRRFQLSTDKDKMPIFDLFSKEGYYLYKIKIPLYRLPFNQNSIQKGSAYTREYDQETGYAKIKRYKIINWEQIRE
jgi:hypothetical protein